METTRVPTYLDADDAGGGRRRVGAERGDGGPELPHGLLRRRRGRQCARLAQAHRSPVAGAGRAAVHGQGARRPEPPPGLGKKEADMSVGGLTERARLKKGKLSRVEVTRTSLAVDAGREGSRRPEEYSDDDGAIADYTFLPASERFQSR